MRQRRVGLLLGSGAVEVGFFVQGFEDQVLVAVGEIAGDLAPIALELPFRFGGEGMIGLRKALLVVGIDPAAIPVDVDDAEHPYRRDPVGDLAHALELVATDPPVMGVSIPSNRNADGLEAERGQALDIFLGHRRIAPAGFPRRGIVERVAETVVEFRGVIDVGGHVRGVIGHGIDRGHVIGRDILGGQTCARVVGVVGNARVRGLC